MVTEGSGLSRRYLWELELLPVSACPVLLLTQWTRNTSWAEVA